MNKKGFSLIELLSVIIIIGIMATIGIVAVSQNINDSRESSFADLAKMYIEKASELRSKDRLPVDIKDKQAILLPLERFKLDKNEDFTTVYGKMKLDYCYVIVTNNNNNYNYYIYMLDDSDHAMFSVEYSEVGKDMVTTEANDIAKITNYKTVNASTSFYVKNAVYKLKKTGDKYLVLEK